MTTERKVTEDQLRATLQKLCTDSKLKPRQQKDAMGILIDSLKGIPELRTKGIKEMVAETTGNPMGEIILGMQINVMINGLEMCGLGAHATRQFQGLLNQYVTDCKTELGTAARSR